MLTRDARHHALSQVGVAGQQRIAAGTVLVIGAGGIGCAIANYLAASGVGRIVISDFDTVDASNLGRQVLFNPGDVGAPKARLVADRLGEQNPEIEISAITARLQGDALQDVVAASDLVLDGSDNFATRFAVSDACVLQQRRLISGSAIRLEGQLAIFGPDYSRTPCYRCLYTEADESLDSCSGNGVLSPVPGVVGALMAVEALKTLAGLDCASGKLQLYDATASEFRRLDIQKRKGCPACANVEQP